MLRITMATFSLSAHTMISSPASWNVKLTSFSSAITLNSFSKESTISFRLNNDTCRRIFPFCILRKSNIWLTSCSICLVFFSIRSTYCIPFWDSFSFSFNSWIGPWIRVSGVRNSCEILVKNLIFNSDNFCSIYTSFFTLIMKRDNFIATSNKATAIII